MDASAIAGKLKEKVEEVKPKEAYSGVGKCNFISKPSFYFLTASYKVYPARTDT